MTLTIIIFISSLLILAYIFDLSASWTKIPSVILLIITGWISQQMLSMLGVKLPNFESILPIVGTLGLILIVLEGSLELELSKKKIPLVVKSIIGSIATIFVISFALAFVFQYISGCTFRVSLVNAIPFSVISSAIAIPSARNLSVYNREFVTYESSFSDIFGVILFNFVALNADYNFQSFTSFLIEFGLIIVVTLVSTLILAALLHKIDHHIKYFPIIIFFILIYAISKYFHLPALILILLMGLFLGNVGQLKQFKWFNMFKPKELEEEVQPFKELTIEATFMVRSIFFLLFGFLINIDDLINPSSAIWSLSIVGSIFILRAIQLKLTRLPIFPLVFVAPRGLITILLFLSISVGDQLPLVNQSIILQVIILTALIMMFGLMFGPKAEKNEAPLLVEKKDN